MKSKRMTEALTVLLVILFVLMGQLWAQGYQTKVYMKQGGAEQVVASGDRITLLSGGILDFEAGSLFKVEGTRITATAAEFNRLAGVTAGTVTANKAIVVDSNRVINYLKVTDLRLTDVTVDDTMKVTGKATFGNEVDITGDATAGSLTVGAAGDKVVQIRFYAPVVDFTQIETGLTLEDQTFTVTGVTTDDIITVNPAADLTAGIGIVQARVSATGTVKVRLCNFVNAPVDPAAVTLNIVAIRKGGT